MDLGCLDMGCISVLDKHSNDAALDSGNKEIDIKESVSSNSKVGKKLSPRGTNQSTFNALNKVTSQIRKNPYRRTSPLNWFPRKKVDSYLKRKIQKLQEVDGMNLTLDETLGDTNPHYSRVLREKMAAREAAHKAMEARKAALVEASWCRILKAARIQSKEAEDLLLKSEQTAVEAFEAAHALGVIMYDIPNCPEKSCQIETSSTNEGNSTTHTVKASFETAFDVDKEVAAAVKTAFTRLTNSSSFSKDEFKEILRKISENPDDSDTNHELSEFPLEYESESGSEVETASQKDNTVSQELDSQVAVGATRQKKLKRWESFEKLNKEKLIEMMLGRIKSLPEDELSSLATIVATCGLNAVLANGENRKPYHYPSSVNSGRRISSLGVVPAKNGNELPSLDKFLVKHMTKLEREVLEAKNSRMEEAKKTSAKETLVAPENNSDLASVLGHTHSSKFEKEIEDAKKNSRNNIESTYKKKPDSNEASLMNNSDLGSILVKHTSKLEKEIAETKRNLGKTYENDGKKMGKIANRDAEVPSLDKFLVKRVSRLEKEVQEAKNKRNSTSTSVFQPGKTENSCSSGELVDKENVDLNMKAGNVETTVDSLDKILIKPVHRLEREKIQASSTGNDYKNGRWSQKKQAGISTNNTDECESLDKVLVKHVSRLEKEKIRFKASEEGALSVKRRGMCVDAQANGEGSLDQILVKHKSRLEREKMMAAAADQPEVNQIKHSLTRREAREKELQAAWAGLSLGNSIKPHLSKLERDKAAWIKAEEEAQMQTMKEV